MAAVRQFILALCLSPLVLAADPTIIFNRDIRPILSDRCYSCHGPDSRQRKAGLRLDMPSSAVVPGNLSNSALYQRITSTNKALRMPPIYSGKEPLTAS